jgi:hypothetical protein
MGKRVAGTCYFKVDGQQLEVSGGVEVPLGNFIRETVMGANRPAGYKETARTPSLKLSAIFRDDFPIELITEGTEMTITVEMPAGQVYTLSEAFMVGEPSAKADDGTVDLEFEGMRGDWQ